MNIPATAGSIIEEEELRAYTKCSQLFYYKGKVELPLLSQIVRDTIELIIVEAIHENEVISNEFAPALRRIFTINKIQDRMSNGEADQLFRNSIYATDQILKSLTTSELIGISGPFDQRIKISKTPVNLRFSGLLRKHKTRELIAPIFLPLLGDHSVLNDPILQLKINHLKQFGQLHNKRPIVSAYIFTIKNDGTVNFHYLNDKEQDRSRIRMIETQVKAMEIGYHYPIVPCPHSCPFKSKCFPGEI